MKLRFTMQTADCCEVLFGQFLGVVHLIFFFFFPLISKVLFQVSRLK